MTRLEEVLGGPALARLRARLRARLARGQALGGRLTLQDPTPDERTAVERLLGRVGRGRALHVDLGALAQVLRNGGLAPDLTSAIVALEGPVDNERARREADEASWAAVRVDVSARCNPRWAAVLADELDTGVLRRLAQGDPGEGMALAGAVVAVLSRLPATALPLAELAATAMGDSHALDAGAPAGTLVLRILARAAAIEPPADVDARRAIWASVGVLADELSAPALVLNLLADGASSTARALALAAETGEPARLSTRQLLRDPPAFSAGRVFVCENPGVIAAAANRLGPTSLPIVCTEGQPRTALRLLLGRLRQSGAALLYHGDFDWPGIQIANLVMLRFAAQPWRFGARDYLAAPAGAPLAGSAVTASWDAALGPAMTMRGTAVHEEAVLEDLLADLQRPRDPAS